MSDPFIAEIRIFPYTFAPLGWALCNGQIMSIQQNTALFSLVGIFYGGNGSSTFGLPNLGGRIPMGMGSGPGLTPRNIGSVAGSETVTLAASQMPAHSHGLKAVDAPPSASVPGSTLSLTGASTKSVLGVPKPLPPLYASSGTGVAMHPSSVAPAGTGQPHNNLQPYLALNFCIALTGVFPQRS